MLELVDNSSLSFINYELMSNLVELMISMNLKFVSVASRQLPGLIPGIVPRVSKL